MKLPNALRRQAAVPYIFITIPVVVLLFFYGYPIIRSLYTSVLSYNLVMPNKTHFSGLENYRKLFADPVFYQALKNTFVWVFYSLVIQFLLGFALALLLWKPFKGRNIYQSAVFIPWAVSGFLIGMMFRWMFNGQFGVVNDLLLRSGIVDQAINFLSLPQTVMIGPVIGCIWYGIPFFAIMILAALQGIPSEMFEAAAMDGVGQIRKFFSIIIPFIKPTLVVTFLLRAIWIFNSADILYVMTGGGPANSSHTLATYLFQKAFSGLDFGYASAIGAVILVILLIYTGLYLFVTKFEKAGDF